MLKRLAVARPKTSTLGSSIMRIADIDPTAWADSTAAYWPSLSVGIGRSFAAIGEANGYASDSSLLYRISIRAGDAPAAGTILSPTPSINWLTRCSSDVPASATKVLFCS
ncbi:unnamed protein product [Protopolystoma xenopodis]|uniref:Uncharacterized protein n=1 Tax=Protopolystoma xenopodis TaxID=117903 RepID=A0A448WN01_9PLAT|nr:unnamed protein product [Protopolystoma xenopodis]